MTLPSNARTVLKEVFGYDDFRPGQAEVISAILDKSPVLAVMPTGSGKSMCYQLPALLDGGLTVVVSPLIALMRAQAQQLRAVGVAAATLNSTNTPEDNDRAWELLRSGELRLLFVSPERIAMEGLTASLARLGVQRVAVDEAHCVSEWGHDFRPEYRQIRKAIDEMGAPQAIAFTATADRATRNDIVERLFSTKPQIFVHSFDRPNIDLRFEPKDNPRRQLIDFLAQHRGDSGIVYCASRKKTEALAGYLQEQGYQAVAYHAGLDLAIRNANQDRFLREDGMIAVATVAFGMGINKPDVRFVVHADMPATVEAYYQEIGRAGRDGLDARTLTLYGVEDIAFRRRQIDEKDIDQDRRAFERKRLGALTRLCEAVRCRRQMLLGYFEEVAPPCGSCDICRGQVALYDASIDAQKALSAVVRTGQRFGAVYLANLLVGEATDVMQRNGHADLKTFGVGKDKPKQAWLAVYRQLFALDALEAASEEHGGFRLTPFGDAVLRGQETVQLRVFVARKGGGKGATIGRPPVGKPLGDTEAGILDKLKALRRELSREEGVPAFMIFPDKTLLQMAEERPMTLSELGRIHGVGQRKLSLYGEAFLEILLTV